MPNLHKKLYLPNVCCRESSKNERLMTTRAMLQQFFRKKHITATWGLRVLINSTIYFEKGLCSFVVRKAKREYAIVLLSLYYYVHNKDPQLGKYKQ